MSDLILSDNHDTGTRPENRLGTGFGPKVEVGFILTRRGGNKDWKAITVKTRSGRWLFSYGTAIAFEPRNPEAYYRKYGDLSSWEHGLPAPLVYLDRRNWCRSATTARHLREFLHDGIDGIRAGLEDGSMVQVDLN